MISYYITAVVGVIFGYFLACLMMMAKGNSDVDLDYRIGQEDDGEY
tara:strand:+ start:497 stop:634 length:138 start_codon:yes stop_codon:yes gene_type:complete